MERGVRRSKVFKKRKCFCQRVKRKEENRKSKTEREINLWEEADGMRRNRDTECKK